MNIRTLSMCALALAFALAHAASVRAEHTRYWRESEASDFQKGKAQGVAVRSDGKITPAPQLTQFAEPNLAYIWTLRTDSMGRVYAAGGSDAKVLRFDAAGKPATVFESGELVAQAIALDAKDNLYVGTSPDGKIYKVTPTGQKSVFFEPGTKYIWAMSFDAQGNLFVATGDKGQVFVVPPDGKGQLFYQSDERHARSLAFDNAGNLLLGTEPSGFVQRIEVTRKNGNLPTAGTAFVLYETNKKEVTSLLTDKAGNIYAASVGNKTANGAAPFVQNSNPQPIIVGNTPNGAAANQGQQPVIAPAVPFFATVTGGTDVVKISADGSPETIWSSRDDLVFTMGFSSDGKVLLGTGDNGAIVEIEDTHVYSNLAKTDATQVMAFAAGANGKMYVATANSGKILTLGPGLEPNGSFESDAFDAKIFSHWGRLTWWGDNIAARKNVSFYVRSGNTSTPDKNWSAWSGPYGNLSGDRVTCPPARFAQWKALFTNATAADAEDLSWVSLAYQPKNVAPVIDDIAIQEPGIRLYSLTNQTAPGNSTPVVLRMPQQNGEASGMTAMNGGNRMRANTPPQGYETKGYRGVLWSVHDDNDDDLTYSVFYRSETEQTWHLMKADLKEPNYTWDATTMPDGAYYLKIVASDAPSNPEDEALTSERVSDRFEIANNPPQISDLKADAAGTLANVSFLAKSSAADISQAKYSMDGGDWRVIFPQGSLSDSTTESYELALKDLSAGDHSVAVQVWDRFQNTSVAKVSFSIQKQARR